MNPEFERNVWLELTPVRMIVMAIVLGLLFFAAALWQGVINGPGEVARWAYYVIVVIWGTRNAARSVVGEIRDRTWDGQRLSSLRADTMTVGKLFGSTIYNWFGGAICLVFVMADLVHNRGALVAMVQLVYYLAVGVFAQAASLLASLVAARRRHAHTQFDVFLYQAVGLAVAVTVYVIWSVANPTGSAWLHMMRADTIMWWGKGLDAAAFLLLSLALFAAWTLMGCYRQMRLELQMRNGSFVWLAFLAFIGVYVAGFDAWLSTSHAFVNLDAVARRLLLAGTTYGALAYVMVFLEPKDRVRLRWLGSAFRRFHVGSALAAFQGWMFSTLAALACGIALIVHLDTLAQDQALVGASLGFLVRDMAVVVTAGVLVRRRGGDFAALVVLFLLYVLLPAIFASLHFSTGLALFTPRAAKLLWFSPVVAWVEAVFAWVLAIVNIVLREERAQPAA